MAKTKTEKIAGIEEQIAQLENQRKRLLQQQKEQERKDRTRRLCKRMGLIESMLPATIALTDEQFQSFLEKAVANEYGRNTLARIAAQGGGITTPTTAAAAQSHGGSGAQTEGNAAKVTG
jgi:C4-type Zn-finger protein